MGLALRVDVQGDLLAAARECEAEVFFQAFGNTAAQLQEEYGPYEDASVFVAIADDDGDVVGAMRYLRPGGSAGLKTLADLGRSPWNLDGERVAAAAQLDPRSTWEVATIGVRRRSRGEALKLALALYSSVAPIALANGMSAFVALLDERVRRLIDTVGFETRTLPGTTTAPYLGSAASTPVYAVRSMLDALRTQSPEAYRTLTTGSGIDAVALPAPEGYRLRSTVGFPEDAADAAEVADPWAVPSGWSVGDRV